ncbi:MAG: hypothetical protein ACE5HE_09980 [Phycisphaerae bacterium]
MGSKALVCALTLVVLSGGCVELLSALTGLEPDGITSDADGGSPSSGGDGSAPGGNDSSGVPVVSLRVSNTSPQVNETVTLTCLLDSGTAEGITIEFQANNGRLDRGTSANTAQFTPAESDIGAEFTFTCRGTNVVGTGAPSRAVTVIPNG